MWPSTIGTKRWAASKQILKIVELMQCTIDQRNSTHSTGDSWYAKDGADCNLAGEIWVTMTLAAKFQYLFAFCEKHQTHLGHILSESQRSVRLQGDGWWIGAEVGGNMVVVLRQTTHVFGTLNKNAKDLRDGEFEIFPDIFFVWQVFLKQSSQCPLS